MEENNKRIVKNTLYLYVRMGVGILLGLFSTRIILNTLGESDYGTYTVVGSFVSMFTILNSILQSGTRRFLALNIGKGDKDLLQRTFSTAFVIHLGIALIVGLLLETFGLWYINNLLNVDHSRMFAVNVIFQLSVITCMLQITQTPYIAAVTAHEKFNIYAYMSIYDIVAKIAVLLFLFIFRGDKLIIYAALLMGVSITSIVIYRIYCSRSFDECKMSLKVDKLLFKEMCSFSGWTTLGHFSAVLNMQGVTMILNYFFGAAVNAARGLAGTVLTIMEQFVTGFITASVPQLVKYYGAGDMERFKKLIFNVSQYTLFLFAIFAVPILLEIDYVLELWLGEVPEFTSAFIKITLIVYLIKYSNIMVDQGLNATGNVKQLSLIVSPIYLIKVPIVFAVGYWGGSATDVYFVGLIPQFLGMAVTLYLLYKYTKFPAWEYFFKIFLKNFTLIIIAMIPPYILQRQMESGSIRFITVCIASILSTLIVLYTLGLNKEVKAMAKNKAVSLLKKAKLIRK